MRKVDYKKDFKELYFPKTEPMIIDVPEMIYMMVDGEGDPNTSKDYKNAMEILYGLSYTIKMSVKKNEQPEGYYEYTIFPLEGLWWSVEDIFKNYKVTDKNKFKWTSMIRQPEFVTKEVYDWALDKLKAKKPNLDYSKVRYEKFKEGLCAQLMHIGSYDNEGPSVKKLEEFIKEKGYETDINDIRKHHEIYLNNPLTTKKENLKTVIRHPIKNKD